MELALERAYADTFAARLVPDQFAAWEACRSAHRFLAYKGKEIVIYNLWFDEPKIVDRLTLSQFHCNIDTGISSLWDSELHGSVELSHTPKMVADAVFMWHVFGSDALYQPYRGKWGLSIPLAYRTRLNPTNKREGVTYALERTVFDATIGS